MVYRVKIKYSADNDTYQGLAKNRREQKRKEVIIAPFYAALDTQVFGVAYLCRGMKEGGMTLIQVEKGVNQSSFFRS